MDRNIRDHSSSAYEDCPPEQRCSGGQKNWLRPRDSNPDNMVQNHVSYH